jgi:putative thioredoxin
MNTPTPDRPIVFDATTGTFEQDVIRASREVPVLVDFWAAWCGPCKSLGPILEKLAADYGGGFVLAKVDVDREQELAGYFQIRSVPTVMLLKDAKVVSGFQGAQPESQIRRFLKQHGVQPAQTAAGAAAGGEPADPAELVRRLRDALAADPDKPELKLDLAVALVANQDFDEASRLIETLPANLGTDARAARALSRIRLGRVAAQAEPRADLEQRLAADPDDHAARHQLGVRLVLEGEAQPGLDHLLELLRRDRSYGDGLPRQTLVDALTVVEDEALARACRRRMTTLLF